MTDATDPALAMALARLTLAERAALEAALTHAIVSEIRALRATGRVLVKETEVTSRTEDNARSVGLRAPR